MIVDFYRLRNIGWNREHVRRRVVLRRCRSLEVAHSSAHARNRQGRGGASLNFPRLKEHPPVLLNEFLDLQTIFLLFFKQNSFTDMFYCRK